MEFDALVNARDVGGIACTDGGTIASGRLIRSEHLDHLTPADTDKLIRLGLTDIVDLRSPGEMVSAGRRRRAPRLQHVRTHNIDLLTHNGTGGAARVVAWSAGETHEQRVGRFVANHLSCLQHGGSGVVTAVRAIARAEGVAHVHCALGKDRTGLVIALALEIVGADREGIVADYVATNVRIRSLIRGMHALDGSEIIADRPPESFEVPAAAMRSVLRWLDTEAGSPEAWLRAQGWTDLDGNVLRRKLRE